jgi:hypothetical protein
MLEPEIAKVRFVMGITWPVPEGMDDARPLHE